MMIFKIINRFFGFYIEYNGEKFHPNPRWMETDKEKWDEWNVLYTNESASEKYKFDMHKNSVAIDQGFEVLTIWSSTNVEDNIVIVKDKIKEIYESKK